ncbi:hypothetical protein SDC9_131603 [bioreactor metagenome]|uniref:Uncharacterized protein n=1 Tax=bioreactor metagenome TaxID=1076179 RepID=A0A645D4V8_9ZZZZ
MKKIEETHEHKAILLLLLLSSVTLTIVTLLCWVGVISSPANVMLINAIMRETKRWLFFYRGVISMELNTNFGSYLVIMIKQLF